MVFAINENIIYSIAIINPLQVFRIAAMSMFDPNLAVIGPAAYLYLIVLAKLVLCYIQLFIL
ncbi:hypothetical protein [Campylobacter iguaniorum]|uniref:hypothetical protein n=1 Tax=Campylobacter iguaniorum TaxID=1244531 RepID=UPI0007C91602|nr:hypothetical protein [Campylobacter iguaniorum]